MSEQKLNLLSLGYSWSLSRGYDWRWSHSGWRGIVPLIKRWQARVSNQTLGTLALQGGTSYQKEGTSALQGGSAY